MVDLSGLRKNYDPDTFTMLLSRAIKMAEEDAGLKCIDLQNGLKIGYSTAQTILDWLADNRKIEPKISTHWLRAGRIYVQNNLIPSLQNMIKQMDIGERRAYSLMMELEKRGVIKIQNEFEFLRVKPMASFADLVRQMKKFAKKYNGRCEPTLLARVMYIDLVSAYRLAQYGEENFGYKWSRTKVENYVRRVKI